MFRKRWNVCLGTIASGGSVTWKRCRTLHGAMKEARFLVSFAEMRLAVEHDGGTAFVLVQHDAERTPAYYREVRRDA